MRRTKNSRTSSIDSVSRNMHYDAAFVTGSNVFSAAGVATIVSDQVVFPRSKVMGRNLTNPNDNEGIVHLIHQIVFYVRILSSLAIDASAQNIAQIKRDNESLISVNGTIPGNPKDNVIYETRLQCPESSRAAGAAGQVSRDVMQVTTFDTNGNPFVAVRPYFMNMSSSTAAQAATTVTTQGTMYVLVETIRVKGEQYRRLLDAYTQTPGLIERMD